MQQLHALEARKLHVAADTGSALLPVLSMCCICADVLALSIDDQLETMWVGSDGKPKYGIPNGSQWVSRMVGVKVMPVWARAGEDPGHVGQMQAGLDNCMRVSKRLRQCRFSRYGGLH